MKFFLLFFLFLSLDAKKPELLLLKNYTKDSNVTGWMMSEKLDGVRAYWDGEKLFSRSGRILNTPKFFTKNFPKHELDGELWIKRESFSSVVSIINTKQETQRWKEIRYKIFEVPNAKGNLEQRLDKVKISKYISVIEQIKVKNKEHLKNFLKSVEDKSGEGIVVRDGNYPYYTGRTNKAFKVKSYKDEECRVVAYNKGNGKYENLLGSLSCRMNNRKVIKIGSGFNDEERRNPPNIGSIITFKYYGLTSKGNPRFPIFLRIKQEDK